MEFYKIEETHLYKVIGKHIYSGEIILRTKRNQTYMTNIGNSTVGFHIYQDIKDILLPTLQVVLFL